MRSAIKILFVCLLISLCNSEQCGAFNDENWPWSVSLFYGDSNVIACEGTLISKRHILTAGHCLLNKDVDKFTVYPGMVFNKIPKDDDKISWKLSKIDVHPDMKLVERNKFIDGGFMSSTITQMDIAVATLQAEIVSSKGISPICLAEGINLKSTEIVGKYSGWSASNKTVENFNLSFRSSDDKFNELRPEGNFDFAEGTGLFVSHSNAPWTIDGIFSMEDVGTKGDKNLVFINVAFYNDWIKKIVSENLTKISVDSLNASLSSVADVVKSKLSLNSKRSGETDTLNTTLIPEVMVSSAKTTEQPKATTYHSQNQLKTSTEPKNAENSTITEVTIPKLTTMTPKITKSSTTEVKSLPMSTTDENIESSTVSNLSVLKIDRDGKALSLNSSSEISPLMKEFSIKVNESTTEAPSNETSDYVEIQPLLAVLGLPPWMTIGAVFLASILFLFCVFCTLARGKPQHH